jgi:hypothetical protein
MCACVSGIYSCIVLPQKECPKIRKGHMKLVQPGQVSIQLARYPYKMQMGNETTAFITAYDPDVSTRKSGHITPFFPKKKDRTHYPTVAVTITPDPFHKGSIMSYKKWQLKEKDLLVSFRKTNSQEAPGTRHQDPALRLRKTSCAPRGCRTWQQASARGCAAGARPRREIRGPSSGGRRCC